jgi:hypothetical protein
MIRHDGPPITDLTPRQFVDPVTRSLKETGKREVSKDVDRSAGEAQGRRGASAARRRRQSRYADAGGSETREWIERA